MQNVFFYKKNFSKLAIFENCKFKVENFEFERQVLGFGDGIEVVKPEGLRKKMKDILRNALANYEIN